MRKIQLKQVVVRVALTTSAAVLLSACSPSYGEGPNSEADPGTMSKPYGDKMGKINKSGDGSMKKSSNSSY